MPRKLVGLTFCLFLVLLATTASPVHAACTNYYPSRAAEVEGQAVCGYSGPGCREPQIVAPGGWDLSLLLRLLGLRVTVSPETPLEVSGLPPGDYEARLEGRSAKRALGEGEREELRMEP